MSMQGNSAVAIAMAELKILDTDNKDKSKDERLEIILKRIKEIEESANTGWY